MSLALHELRKVFTTPGGSRVAVDDVTLEFEAGRLHALLGPSGCGKTTLLRLIAGFEQPTRGDVVHRGRSLNAVPPYRRGFPLVFQSFALFPHMTVTANVAYGLRVRGVAREEVEQRVARALALLRIETERHKHPAQLSGGQQQRVALARCLVLEPEVILLDEPLSSLDAELRVSMRREIRSLQQTLGITAIYVTHDQEEALSIADRVVVMRDGRVEQDGAPRDIHQRPRTEFVARFMGCPNVLTFVRSESGAVIMGREHAVTPPADATRVVIRPDAIRLRDGGMYEGRVAERTYLGGRIEYVVETTDGLRLTVTCPGHATHGEGDVVSFDILPMRLHFV